MNRVLVSGAAALSAAAGLSFAVCPGAEPSQTTAVVMAAYDKPLDVVETAKSAGMFNTLAAAIEAAGLVDALKGDGPFTVFAPTDDAFKALPEGTVDMLLKTENKGKLAAILKYHVVPAQVRAKDVRTMGADTLNGQRVDVRVDGGKVTVDGATVTKTDVMASNGVIHVIDRVIMPSERDIVATAIDAGEFKTLASLLQKAELVDALKASGPFTVFAPTDAAFAKLPAGTLEMLGKPENKAKLVGILKYHVVPGRVFSDAAAKGATAVTLQGSNLTTMSKDGKVRVESAGVVKADLDASNGVIHVIDTVIMPKS